MKKNKELTDYCKAVKKNLHCSKQLKKEILHALESDIEEYLEQNPATTAEDVREHFGGAGHDSDSGHYPVLVFTTTAILVVMENSRAAIYYYSEEIGEYE